MDYETSVKLMAIPIPDTSSPIPFARIIIRLELPQDPLIPPKDVLPRARSGRRRVDEHDERRVDVPASREEGEPISDEGSGLVLVQFRILHFPVSSCGF